MRKNHKKNTAAFTLVELMLYVSIALIMLLSISSFLSLMLEVRVKEQSISEVEQQGIQVVQYISQTIRNADDVTSPAISNNGTTLSLDVGAASDTVFALSSTAITVSENGGSAVPLTSSRVSASDLEFYNYAHADTPDSIKFNFTLTHNNPDHRREFDWEKTFHGAASLR